MTISITKALALGGLCALLLGAGHAAAAQDYGHQDYGHQGYGHHGSAHHGRRARRHLQVLHAVYSHEIKSGHPGAAMQAHMRAKAIRARIRARRNGGG